MLSKALSSLNTLRIRLFSKVTVSYLRLLGADVCWTTLFYGPVSIIGDPANLSIGSHTKINHNVLINCTDLVSIGSYVTISSGVTLHTSTYQTFRVHVSAPIRIQSHVWIASSAVILPGVSIGTHSIVGALSLVTSSTPPNTVSFGSPARTIREIDSSWFNL
ncbi:hypothetical protein [Synechococcus sp. BS56D]|uniref:acyltransferase n=1 Tax=Synechococcus sp. BS56D TaxID=2055944 RepID=UPI00351593E2